MNYKFLLPKIKESMLCLRLFTLLINTLSGNPYLQGCIGGDMTVKVVNINFITESHDAYIRLTVSVFLHGIRNLALIEFFLTLRV